VVEVTEDRQILELEEAEEAYRRVPGGQTAAEHSPDWVVV
jgi:hypothetical protein